MNRPVCLTLIAAGMTTSVHAQVAVLQGVNPAAANSVVPSLPSERLASTFDWTGLSISSNGSRWVFKAFLNSSSTTNEVILTGTGTNGQSTQVVAREAGNATGMGTNEKFQFFDAFPRINDSGTVAFAGDFASDPNFDDFIAKWSAGTYTLVAREEASAASILGTGILWDTLDSPAIDNAGTVGFRATSLGNATAETDAAIIFGNSVVARKGVTRVANGTERWEEFDLEDFRVSANGTEWLLQGNSDLIVELDDIVVLNDTVVLREGTNTGGLPGPSSYALRVFMSHDGTKMVQGAIFGGQDFIVYDGSAVAFTNNATGLSTGELWSDSVYLPTFFTMCENSVGDYVIVGLSDSGNPNADAVMVLNGTTEVLRENDPVDVNGDGLFNDNAFIKSFHNEDFVLTDDLALYGLVSLQNNFGVDIGEALIYKQVSETPPCIGDIADDFGAIGTDGQVTFGDFLAMLGRIGPCPTGAIGCTGDIADDFGTLGADGQVAFGDFLALLGRIGPCQ